MVAQVLRIAEREPFRGELTRARMGGRFAVGNDDRAAATDLVEELLGQRGLAPEQRQDGDYAGRAEYEAEQRQQRLSPMAARFVESGEQRLDEAQTTRPSLI